MQKLPDLEKLIALCHHRWSIRLVAELDRGEGAKFVTLLNRLKLSRAPLSATLHQLVQLGLVRRNTGYGHPMRPEYLLTQTGKSIGPHCQSLAMTLSRAGWEKIGFDKWSLPLAALIGGQTLRFNELRGELDSASPRAITLALKSLENQDWIDRIIVSEYPLAAGYQLRPLAKEMLPDLYAICAAMP